MNTYNAIRKQNSFSVLQFCKPDLMVHLSLNWNIVSRVTNVTSLISSETRLQGLPMLPTLSLLKHGYKCYQPYLFWNRDTRVTNVPRAISSETRLQGLQMLPALSSETGLQGFMNVTNHISSETGLQMFLALSLLKQGFNGLWILPTLSLWSRVTKITKVTSFIFLETRVMRVTDNLTTTNISSGIYR